MGLVPPLIVHNNILLTRPAEFANLVIPHDSLSVIHVFQGLFLCHQYIQPLIKDVRTFCSISFPFSIARNNLSSGTYEDSFAIRGLNLPTKIYPVFGYLPTQIPTKLPKEGNQNITCAGFVHCTIQLLVIGFNGCSIGLEYVEPWFLMCPPCLQTESMVDCNLPNMAMPLMWPEIHVTGDRPQFQQQWQLESLSQPVWVKEENNRNVVASENSLMTYDSPGNSGKLLQNSQIFCSHCIDSHDNFSFLTYSSSKKLVNLCCAF